MVECTAHNGQMWVQFLLSLMIINKVIFLKLFFMIFALLFSILILHFNNPIYSIFSLIGALICSIFILLLSGIEYLSYIYLIVYVGAIAILFLFVIMMLNIKSQEENVAVFNPYRVWVNYIYILLIFKFVQYSFFNIGQIEYFPECLRSEYFFSDILQKKTLENMVFIRTPNDLEKIPDIYGVGLYLYTTYFFNFILVGYVLLMTMVITLILASNKKNKK